MFNNYTSYKNELLHRYWEYQKENYSDWERFFDHPRGLYSRPPVFLRSESWRNVIINPNANQHEIHELLNLIPKGERHKWFRSMNSSQALTLSIFGNLIIQDSLHFLSELKDDDGLDLFSKAQISSDNFTLEYRVNHLGEPRSTSLDGFISGEYRIAIECKFTESKIGSCSRPTIKATRSNYERDFCDGSYSIQRKRHERCSLTEIGVKYWRYVPSLFKWENNRELNPCPMNKNYQLVRNILAIGVKPDGTVSVKNGHVVLIYDERNPACQMGGDVYSSYMETKNALIEQTMLRKCSWQKIIKKMRTKNILPWLTNELELKYSL